MMHRQRRGFSLMEVMLATSILLGSSIILIELANIGRKQANAAYNLNMAQLLCQAKLDEIVAGISPLKVVADEELEDNPGWLFTVETQPMTRKKLVGVKVTVSQAPDDARRPIRFSLVRWLPAEQLKSSETSFEADSSVTQRRSESREGP